MRALILSALLLLLPLSAAAQSIKLPVRGTRSAALWVTAPTQTLTLLKRDMNIYAGADLLVYEVRDAAGTVLHKGSLADDGNAAKGGGAGTLQSASIKLALGAGYHTVRLTSAGSDAVFDLQAVGAKVQWAGGSMMLNDPKLGGSLYLHAPAKGGTFTVATWHTGGAGQTVALREAGKTLGSVTLAATHTNYTITLPAAPASGAARVLELVLPKMDLYFSSAQVSAYASSPANLFPAGLTTGIYPLAQDRAVAPGGISPFQLRLKNRGTSAATLTFSLPGPASGFSLALPAGQPKAVALQPGQEKLLPLILSCAAGVKVGTKAALIIGVAHSAYPGWPASVRVNAVAAAPAQVKRTRPFLYYSAAEIAAANTRAADPKQPWAKTIRDGIIKSADAWLTLPINVPTGEGAWSGFYVCNSGPGLTFDRTQPTQHLCKVEGKVYTGEPYDSCWRTRRYHELNRAARALGLAHRLTGKAAYAQRAAAILTSFAGVYMSNRVHDNKWGSSAQTATPSKSGGRLLSQTLDESYWLITFLSAYDSVAASGQLTVAQRVDIEHNLIRPAVAKIQQYDAGKSNWQAWHNAAIGAAGYALEVKPWITAALSGSHGFGFHMKSSMLADGFWYEGSIGYHLYTLSAYRWLALAARHLGQNLYKQGLDKMVRAPLLMALPDLTFPKLNDGGTGGLSSMRGALEAAAALTGDKDATAALRLLYNDQKLSRSSEEALLLGASLGTGASTTFPPFDFTATGYAVLRGGAGAGRSYLGLDYGPHGGGHGHTDKLQLLLYGGGALQLPDMGTTAYRLPYHAGFFKQTLAHNTVMLDEKSQAKGNETARKVGRFSHIALPSGPSLGLVQATVGSDVFGTGNSVTRAVLLVDGDHALDQVQVTAPAAKTTDLIYHGAGRLTVSGGGASGPATSLTASWASSTAGHKYLTPPPLSGGTAKTITTGFLWSGSANPSFTFSRSRGISHDMDSVQGLSGGKLITTDKKQGAGAVLWEADNSGAAQFLTRTYTDDKLELSAYDSLEFWAKVNVTGLKWFGIKIYDLPAFDQAAWRLDNKVSIPANTWVKFTINLKKPDSAWGGAKTAEQIVFRLQGSGKGPAKVQVLLDGLVVKKAGKAEVPIAQGLRLLTHALPPATAPVRYIAASAISNPPTSAHPVVLLRGKGSLAYLNLLTPFDGPLPPGGAFKYTSGWWSVPRADGGRDHFALDPKAGQWGCWERQDKAGLAVALGSLAAATYCEGPRHRVQGKGAVDFILKAKTPKDLVYRGTRGAPYRLVWALQSQTKADAITWTARVDGKAWPYTTTGGHVINMYASYYYIDLDSLPAGDHQITIVRKGPAPDAGPSADLAVVDSAPADSRVDTNQVPADSRMDTKGGTQVDTKQAPADSQGPKSDGAGQSGTPNRGCRCQSVPGSPVGPLALLALLILLRRRLIHTA